MYQDIMIILLTGFLLKVALRTTAICLQIFVTGIHGLIIMQISQKYNATLLANIGKEIRNCLSSFCAPGNTLKMAITIIGSE